MVHKKRLYSGFKIWSVSMLAGIASFALGFVISHPGILDLEGILTLYQGEAVTAGLIATFLLLALTAGHLYLMGWLYERIWKNRH